MISKSKVPQPNLSDSSIITAFQFTDTTHTRESWQSRCNYADYTERAKQTLLNNFLSSLSKVIQCLDNQAHVTGFIYIHDKITAILLVKRSEWKFINCIQNNCNQK